MKTKLAAMTAAVLLHLVGSAYAADPSPSRTTPATKPSATINPVVSRLVTMHLARLAMEQIASDQIAGQIVADARVYAGSYGTIEHDQLRNNLTAIAVGYIEFVEEKAKVSTTWAAGRTQASAADELTKLKAEVQKPNADVLFLLRRANEVLAWSMGQPAVNAQTDHFARHDDLARSTITQVPEAARLSDPTPARVAEARKGAIPTVRTLAGRLATIHLVRAAIGEEEPGKVEELVTAEVRTYAEAKDPAAAGSELREKLKSTATRYVDLVAERISGSTKWPSDKTAEVYAVEAAKVLDSVRAEIAAVDDEATDLAEPLARVNRVLAWTAGSAELQPAMDHFGGHPALVNRVVEKILLPSGA